MSAQVSGPLAEALGICWNLHNAGAAVPKPVEMSPEGVLAATVSGIIAGTAGRNEKTYEAILHLAANDYGQQGAMLLRSMFEDVTVAHWLLLHEDEAEHYAGRFIRHAEAMRLEAARVAERYGAPQVYVAGLRSREQALTEEFGPNAERSWWGRDANGRAVRLPAMVETIGTAERFWGRTHGETPILRETYAIVVKWSNQLLHHTASGVVMQLIEPEHLSIASPRPVVVIGRAYYLFAMMICAVLDANGTVPQHTEFWNQFMGGLPHMALATQQDREEHES
jgi:hypothetical protein